MIPFERETSLTASEEYVKSILESNWTYVVRSTPAIKEDLKGRFPKVSEQVSRQIQKDVGRKDFNEVFSSGIPDFLAFDDDGSYVFVEVKSSEDGLRHTQLNWIRRFQGINVEIWFAKSSESIEDKISGESFSAYTFREKKGDNSDNKIVDESGGSFLVELPKDLGSVIGLSMGDSFSWKLKSKDELILDSK